MHDQSFTVDIIEELFCALNAVDLIIGPNHMCRRDFIPDQHNRCSKRG
ncbi:hypothetical protein C5S53_16740 [Methanophagales archaeon]|nr:hypothetical protein C5S53_16740 [Methanophagales archaeon]